MSVVRVRRGVGQHLRQFSSGKRVLSCAELALDLCFRLLAYQLAQLLRPEGQESADDAVAGTAAVPGGDGVVDDLQVQAAEGAAQDVLWAVALAHQGGDRRHRAEGLLDVNNQVIVDVGVKLHQEAAGRGHGVVGGDEYPQRHGAGYLLGLREIRRQIFGDFTGRQRHGAAVRLGSAGFPDDVQNALAHRAADVELAIARRHVDGRLPQVAAYLCRPVGLHQNAPHRPLATHLQRHAVRGVLQQRAHQHAAGQQPAQRRRGGRRGAVDTPRLFHQCRRDGGDAVYVFVRNDDARQRIQRAPHWLSVRTRWSGWLVRWESSGPYLEKGGQHTVLGVGKSSRRRREPP